MNRPTVLIITDRTVFSNAVSSRWPAEWNTPSFVVKPVSSVTGAPVESTFDLAILGAMDSSGQEAVTALQRTGKPVLFVGSMNGNPAPPSNVIFLPEFPEWPEVVVTLARQLLQHQHATAEAARLSQVNSNLEGQATLGRYILEARHSLNNALTSILGNSDLILFDAADLSPRLAGQVETIRNMALRMNEALQRFSSLHKEMRLVDQEAWRKARGKSAAAGD